MTGDTDRGGITSDPAELADTDFAEPGGDAPITTPSTGPADSASRVGDREPGDKDDIGSTDAMTSSTGGLAGTSR